MAEKSVSFITLGCRLNHAETAGYAAALERAGWRVERELDGGRDAVVVNSCVVTRTAERQTLQTVRALKREHPESTIVLVGCAAALPGLASAADVVLKSREPGAVAEALCGAVRGNVVPRHFTKRALLKVQDGCPFRCAYCIVPFTRGPSVTRPMAQCLDEAHALLDAGFLEIVVTGCNLACYDDNGATLPTLVDALCEIAAPYGARIRLSSVEPGGCELELADAMLRHRNFCRFIHMPVQTCDDAVLRAMGRRYTANELEASVAALEAKVPMLSIGVDMIAGLPGEDAAAFSKTCDFFRRHDISIAHVFPYSPRPGTRAVTMPNRPTRHEARQRAAELRTIAAESAARYRSRWIGMETEVLVEGQDTNLVAHGYNEAYILFSFTAPHPVNIPSMYKLRITRDLASGR